MQAFKISTSYNTPNNYSNSVRRTASSSDSYLPSLPYWHKTVDWQCVPHTEMHRNAAKLATDKQH